MWPAISLIVLLGAQVDLYATMNPILRVNETSFSTIPILKFPTSLHCYNFVYFSVSPDRFSEVLQNFQEVYPKSLTIFRATSTGLIKRAACNLFVIFTNDNVDYELLKRIPFRSFSRILLMSHNVSAHYQSDLHDFTNYWFRKSINVQFVDYAAVNDLADFLSDDVFIDRLLRNEKGVIALRASFFNCPPFVIKYKRDGKSDVDGLEMRCLREIARNWMVSYRDKSNSSDTWCAVLNDLSKNVSDLAMCSVWESHDHAQNYDLSSYINYQCITALVPNPSSRTQATIIYLPFQWNVWLFFCASLLFTAIAIKYSIEVELNLNLGGLRDRKYKEFVYVLLELVSISTAHGLFNFPYRLTIQFLFFGWILLMFLLDTGYSTVYTSIMTVPQYSKPIETVQDFLDADLYWSEPGDLYIGIQQAFRNTGSANLLNFADRMIIEKSLNDRINLLENRKLGKIIKVLSNKYVTDIDYVLDYAIRMTPMKECILNYYTVLAFQRNSPFTRIFDRQLGRLKASGLIHSWFDTLISQHFNKTLMHRVLDHHYLRNTGPKTLELEHLSGGFYLLFTGITISMLTLLFECYWKRLTRAALGNDSWFKIRSTQSKFTNVKQFIK